ncbi:MAG: hypothetical protein O3B47_01250, partial [bacterium]|nr:hypothetical protein [bacterium]
MQNDTDPTAKLTTIDDPTAFSAPVEGTTAQAQLAGELYRDLQRGDGFTRYVTGPSGEEEVLLTTYIAAALSRGELTQRQAGALEHEFEKWLAAKGISLSKLIAGLDRPNDEEEKVRKISVYESLVDAIKLAQQPRRVRDDGSTSLRKNWSYGDFTFMIDGFYEPEAVSILEAIA